MTDSSPNPKDLVAGEAFMLRMWAHAVGVINEQKRVHDLGEGRSLHQETPGSGGLIKWKQHFGILTANHVIENADKHDLRFFFRPDHIERKSRAEIDRQGFVEFHKGVRAKILNIIRCQWEDVAFIAIDPETRNLEFHDFEFANGDATEGAVVHGFGFPSHNPLGLGSSRTSDREEHTFGLAPVAWTNTVIPKPASLVESLTAENPYDPKKHFLIEWNVADPTMSMRGFSGAATWTDKAIPQTELWSPKPVFAGIVTHYYDRIKVGRVIRASLVKNFLEEAFGKKPRRKSASAS